ncbi:MAG: energy transducer TonB [Rikenellaceae bacterium]|nr:energy transducer TonB [Rikenellaceae bacterium]
MDGYTGNEYVAARVNFVINTKGELTDIQIKEYTEVKFANTVVKVLELSPLWEPGYEHGKAVNVSMSIPVMFNHYAGRKDPKMYRFLSGLNKFSQVDLKLLTQTQKQPSFKHKHVDSFEKWISAEYSFASDTVYRVCFAICEFEIDKKGRLQNIEFIEDNDPGFSKIIRKILSKCPKWKWDDKNDIESPVRYRLEIKYID